VGKFRDRYRPERHYMRGPGPKWHAKHRAALVVAASAQQELTGAQGASAAEQHGRSIVTWIVPVAAAMLLGFVAVAALA
jgi:hypothetical protein